MLRSVIVPILPIRREEIDPQASELHPSTGVPLFLI